MNLINYKNKYIMKSIRFFFLLFLFSCCTSIMADSPITSTYFADVYKSEKIVEKAILANGEITQEIMDYLADETNPVDVKIAIVNALSWSLEGSDNYETFLDYLKSRYSTKSEITLLIDLDASTLISLAYIKAMGDYFDVEEAFLIAQIAVMKNPNSLSINIINALICAQIAMDYDWCAVFQVCDVVIKDENLIQDLRPKAIEQIMEYINLYSDNCVK